VTAAARVLALAACVAALGCARRNARPAGADTAGLRREIEALRHQVDERLAGSPYVQEVLDRHPASEVVVGLRTKLVEDVVREVGRAYLDRVELDLDLERAVDERREVEVDTPFGKVVAGEWRLHLTVHRVHAVLRARTPELKAAGTHQIAARVPVVLEGATGTATAQFTWNARSMASVVCRDFDARRQVRGSIAADDYTLVGRFDLTSAPNAVRVQPVFPRRRFHVRVDLAEQSWADVRRALEDQDQVLKCGLALDPDAILPKLRARLAEGFDLDLPASIFRPVDLPAGLRQSVAVEDTEVDLAVQTDALRVEPQAVWYAAAVRSRLRASGAQ
jgi:hypothetical protein